jgi:hypothetical protein
MRMGGAADTRSARQSEELPQGGGDSADESEPAPPALASGIVDLGLWLDASDRQAATTRELPDPEAVTAVAGRAADGHEQDVVNHHPLPFSAESAWADGFAAGFLAAQPSPSAEEERRSASGVSMEELGPSNHRWTANAEGPEFQQWADDQRIARARYLTEPWTTRHAVPTPLVTHLPEVQSEGGAEAPGPLRLVRPARADGAALQVPAGEPVARSAAEARMAGRDEGGHAPAAPAAPAPVEPADIDPGHASGRPVNLRHDDRSLLRDPREAIGSAASLVRFPQHAAAQPAVADAPSLSIPGESVMAGEEPEAVQPAAPRPIDATRAAYPYLAVAVDAPRQAPAADARADVPAPVAAQDEPELPDQIVQSLRLHATSGGGEARVQLRPEYLGELTVRVVVEDGVVTARLEAERPAVREWIERHEVMLRQALGEHGLTLDVLSVSERGSSDEVLDDRDRENASDREQPDRNRRPRRRADQDEPRFEVTA